MNSFARLAASAVTAFSAVAIPMFSGCVVASSSGCGPTARYSATTATETPYTEAAGLDVQSENGAITVARSNTGELAVTAEVHAQTQERADATTVVTERAADGSVLVRVNWPDGKRLNNEWCDLNVTVPGTRWLRMISANGRLTASGMAGVAELRTSNGRITLTGHDGPATLVTSNGRIEADEIDGSVNARSSNGSIVLNNIGGFASAETSNGRIEVSLADGAEGPVKLTTSNGAVTLDLPGSFAGSLSARTSNGSVAAQSLPGSVKVSGRRSSKTLEFGGGGEPSSVTSSNGSVTIRARAGG